ncbi:hypothetical protein BVRB_5g113820 [Beta vulgaris subsp. vulgaris]|nr:hypothetical protein BVRB_5g113820 [Beta vulgaris subsp. vulgaris]
MEFDAKITPPSPTTTHCALIFSLLKLNPYSLLSYILSPPFSFVSLFDTVPFPPEFKVMPTFSPKIDGIPVPNKVFWPAFMKFHSSFFGSIILM